SHRRAPYSLSLHWHLLQYAVSSPLAALRAQHQSRRQSRLTHTIPPTRRAPAPHHESPAAESPSSAPIRQTDHSSAPGRLPPACGSRRSTPTLAGSHRCSSGSLSTSSSFETTETLQSGAIDHLT